jgi:hypothetical protein
VLVLDEASQPSTADLAMLTEAARQAGARVIATGDTAQLGERLAAKPEPWLTRYLGVLSPDASPALREEYVQRAGTAAAYREARGITDPQQAVSFGPHPEPELAAMQRDTFQALEIADEHAEIRAMSRGELEARVLQANAQATAPPDVSERLRVTAQAEADAWQQSAAAETEHDLMQAHKARALANQMAAGKSRLEAASARYEEWSAKTIGTRDTAGKARAELQRRGHEPAPAQTPQPQSALDWWQELEANIEAVDRALARQQQAAIDVGWPWPSVRHPAAQPEAERSPQLENSVPEQPEIVEPEPDSYGERAALLDELQAQADDAAARVRRSEQSWTPAVSTPRGWSGRPTPSQRLTGRQKHPMRSRWSCSRSGRVGLLACWSAIPSASAPAATASWASAARSWPGARMTASIPFSRARSASLARADLPSLDLGLTNSTDRRAGSAGRQPYRDSCRLDGLITGAGAGGDAADGVAGVTTYRCPGGGGRRGGRPLRRGRRAGAARPR